MMLAAKSIWRQVAVKAQPEVAENLRDSSLEMIDFARKQFPSSKQSNLRFEQADAKI